MKSVKKTKPYEKPMIVKQIKMRFPLDILEAFYLKRKTECNRCGECCQSISVAWSLLDAFLSNWPSRDFILENWRMLNSYSVVASGRDPFGDSIYFVCVKYDFVTNLCSIHGKNKPPICADYPSHDNFLSIVPFKKDPATFTVAPESCAFKKEIEGVVCRQCSS